jgi:hypothetical protein
VDDRINQRGPGEQATLDAYAEVLAARAREAGLQAAASADPEWVERVLNWLRALPRGVEVCADDVRREFGTSSAMGSVFRTARCRGLIEAVGMTESTAITRHRGLQRVWRRT